MKTGFRTKIFLGFFILLLIQGLVLFFWVGHVMKTALLEEIKSRGVPIGMNLSARMTEPILAMDFLRMKDLVDETKKSTGDIFYTFVLDQQGRPLIHSFANDFPTALKTINPVETGQPYSMKLLDTGDQLVYDYAVPVKVGEHRLGTVRIGLYRTRAEEALTKITVSAVVTISATILLAGITGTLLLNPIMRRIRKLHESSQQVLRGNFDVKTAPELKKNCWEVLNCDKPDCPAYENYHHRCWYLAGTLCPECVEGRYAKKIDSCRKCRIYKSCSGDELQSLAESFDAMTINLKGNLSDLKTAEGILNEQKARLQTILDAIPDFISLQNVDGEYVSVNRAFCEMMDRDKSLIVGKKNKDLYPKHHAEFFDREDRRIIETGKPLDKENKIVRGKVTTWLHVLKIPVKGYDGEINGLVCSGRDITQLRAVQDQLTHAQKMESVGRLAAGVAHEINTPLGIILGYAQLLLEDFSENLQAAADIETIVKQTKICSKIVSDLLNFSRVKQAVTSLFDINSAIEEVVDVVEHTFSLNHVSVERNYHDGEIVIEGDKDKIKQVFINLLNNAFDAVGEKGKIKVKTLLEKEAQIAKIIITDSGKGIPPENLNKIFDPFYTTKGPDKGTGLGLSVTFAIIKEHSGSIRAFSPPKTDKENKTGAEFIIELPTISNYLEGEQDGNNSGNR